jgi:VanZ family protein
MIQIIVSLRPVSRYILIIWVLTIITVSSLPSLPTLKIHTAKSDIRLDYFIHFCEYGFLAFLAFLTFTGKDFILNTGRTILITLFLILFALFDETHQIWIPGRAFNYRDIIGNFTGIIAGVIFCVFVFRKIVKTVRNNPK